MELIYVVVQRKGRAWTGMAVVEELRFEATVESGLDIKMILRNQLEF